MKKTKKTSKIDAFKNNLALAKADRQIPSVGVAAGLVIRETRIEKYFKNIEDSFFEIGKELSEIQKEKEYSEKSFEAYIKNRWDKTRSWGYQMIEAYQIKAELPESVQHVVQNQRQALAVGRIPKSERVKVLQAVSGDGESLGKKIQNRITEKAEEISKSLESEAEFRVIVKDFNGEEVPEEISEAFQYADQESKEQILNAQQIKNFLERDDAVTIEARGLRETAKDLLAGLKTHLTKHVLCPKCVGKKCAVCSKRGFVSNHFATKGIGKK